MQPWGTMPWYGMVFGPIMMIVWLAILIFVAAAVIRWLQRGTVGPLPRVGKPEACPENPGGALRHGRDRQG